MELALRTPRDFYRQGVVQLIVSSVIQPLVLVFSALQTRLKVPSTHKIVTHVLMQLDQLETQLMV